MYVIINVMQPIACRNSKTKIVSIHIIMLVKLKTFLNHISVCLFQDKTDDNRKSSGCDANPCGKNSKLTDLGAGENMQCDEVSQIKNLDQHKNKSNLFISSLKLVGMKVDLVPHFVVFRVKKIIHKVVSLENF